MLSRTWLVISVLLLMPLVAWSHDLEIKKCMKVETVQKVKEVLNENGTLSEAYDRNGDGKVDIEVISHLLAAKISDTIEYEHAEHPLLYVVDLDYDGVPDVVYVDKTGTGTCEDIVLYEDLTTSNGRDSQRGNGTI